MTPVIASGAPPRPARIAATLRALGAPRRALPVAIVSAAMVFAQVSFSRDPMALPVAILLCLAFVFVAPVSWRALLPAGLERSASNLARFGLYLAICAAAVLAVGVGIPAVFGIGRTFLTSRVSLTVCLVLCWVGGWGLGRDIENEELVRHERSRSTALAREVELAHLGALRAHLDPHFLFNTLNAIAEWCREDGEVAEQATLRLADMLRAVLDGIRAPFWPLARELELVRGLFSMHQLRDPTLFRATIDAADGSAGVPVPPMSLLSLAENAVKHGPARGHRGEITLTARVDGTVLTITLENPGPYAGPRPGSVGLPSLERRLRLLYGDQARLELAAAGDRTVARLHLPVQAPDQKVVA